MPYKTISLKLLRPTRKKAAALENAIERYSLAYEYLLKAIRKRATTGQNSSKVGVLKLLDKEMMAQIGQFDVQPFKDSLKLDVSMVLSAYFSRKRNDHDLSYPNGFTDDKDIIKLLEEKVPLTQRRIDAVFDKYRHRRPLLFCRFDDSRDYAILRRGTTNQYYAKLFLYNLKNAVVNEHMGQNDLCYLDTGEALVNQRSKQRYLLFPLDIGQWQEKHLVDIEKGIATPKSAQLICTGGEYYLNVRLWYEPGPIRDAKHYVGICRGVHEELYYAISNEQDEILEFGPIACDRVYGKNRLHLLANEIIRIAVEKKSRIILCNLVSRSDGLGHQNETVPLTVGEYNSIVNLVAYKAEFAGLQDPVIVSASGIFYRCPKCFTFKYTNRLDNDKFLCVRCGYFHGLELVGASNLARTLIHYHNNKISVRMHRTEGKVYFNCPLLNIEYVCNEDEYMIERFCEYLQQYIEKPPRRMTKKQRSILHKLTNANHVRESVTFVEH